MGTGAQAIASVTNEVSHHGNQIGVLRDLYRLRSAFDREPRRLSRRVTIDPIVRGNPIPERLAAGGHDLDCVVPRRSGSGIRMTFSVVR